MGIRLILLTLMVFLLTAIVSAQSSELITEIQFSLDNVTFTDSGNTTGEAFAIEDLNDRFEYFFRARHFNTTDNNASAWVYTKQRTRGEDNITSLSVVAFVLLSTIALFLLPMVFRRKIKNPLVATIFSRCAVLLGIYLMMLNAAIMLTITDFVGLNLTKELTRYMWLFGTAGWIFMGFLVFKTLLDILSFYKLKKHEERFGGMEE